MWIQREGFAIQSSFDKDIPLYLQLKFVAVIFIGEIHNLEEHRVKNGELINHIYERHSSLWGEGCDLADIVLGKSKLSDLFEKNNIKTGNPARTSVQITYVKDEFRETAKSWDNDLWHFEKVFKYSKLIFSMHSLFVAIDRTADFIDLFQEIIFEYGKDITSDTHKLFGELVKMCECKIIKNLNNVNVSPAEQLMNITLATTVIFLKLRFQLSLLKDLLNYIKKDRQTIENNIVTEAHSRNELLADHAIDEIKSNRQPIFVGGIAHFCEESTTQIPVTAYKSVATLMKEKMIPFITLFPYQSLKNEREKLKNQQQSKSNKMSFSEKRDLFKNYFLNENKQKIDPHQIHEIIDDLLQNEIIAIETRLEKY